MDQQTEAVQRMQDYIESHLDQEITLTTLSKVSLFSPWHSHRLFKEQLGLTPAEYIRRMRLSHSAMRLKQEQCFVTDAAYDCGFQSIDGFTRAFYREFGCNPGDYVKDPIPIRLFIPYGVKFKELRKDTVDMENLQSVFAQVVRKPERKIILKRGVQAEDYFAYPSSKGSGTCPVPARCLLSAMLQGFGAAAAGPRAGRSRALRCGS